jgi:glycosyltransferase involved in cell wall biosynthesis
MPPLLTVAIPTWNRSGYLAQSLEQLHSELRDVVPGTVEVIVSDNCSPDQTPAVVEAAQRAGLDIRYVRNDRNVGWALNFAQAYDMSSGRYVLLMGDDDLFVDGGVALLLERLRSAEYGVVILKPYGFDEDFRRELPGGIGRVRQFDDSNRFLVAAHRFFTLTSACVVNKSLLGGIDSREFCDTDLAAFHLVLKAALRARQNLFLDRYLVASKRQNSFSYEYVNVFVDQMWRIIDMHVPLGLEPATVRALERRKLLSYYPFYLFDLRVSRRGDLQLTYRKFAARFADRWLFQFWLAPIIRLPRPLAIAWGAVTTVIGRVLDGQLWRGIRFGWDRVKRRLSSQPRLAHREESSGK